MRQDGKTYWSGATWEWVCTVDGDNAEIEWVYAGSEEAAVKELHPELYELIVRMAVNQAPFDPQTDYGTWNKPMLGVA